MSAPEAETYDCLACGRCCFGADNYVELFEEDLITLGPARLKKFAILTTLPRSQWRTGENAWTKFMKMTDGHCAALDPTPGDWACTIYENRPLLCRVYEPGSADCLKARARPTQKLEPSGKQTV